MKGRYESSNQKKRRKGRKKKKDWKKGKGVGLKVATIIKKYTHKRVFLPAFVVGRVRRRPVGCQRNTHLEKGFHT